MKRGRPITPEEIPEKKTKIIPEFVFDVFNEMLIRAAEESTDKTLKVIQKDVVKRIKELADDIDKYDIHWLDVEPYYEESGWKVEYDKPAYCEFYDAAFYFTPK